VDFYEVIRTRRSIRRYRPDPVPGEILERVLDAARIAPSGSNRQPTRLILVRDAETKRALVPFCGNQGFLAEAPIVAVACGHNLHYNRGNYMGDYAMLVDVAIAVDHLTLAARAEGLGTCWIGLFDNDGIKKLLSIPEEVQVVALTPLGYPSQEFEEPGSRKPLSEVVYYERYGAGGA